ncbi:MAG: hypothetical protein QG608_2709 [Actinomycetota bacterium]|nr:hypothetical protein [Actinomycetota bacterium]
MLTDGWPDASDFPYRALIRIRYSHEIDLVALEIVQRSLLLGGRTEITGEVAASLTRLSARRALGAVGRPEPIREKRDLERLEALRRWAREMVLKPSPDPWRPDPQHWKPDPTPWVLHGVELVRTLSTGVAFLTEVLDPEFAQEAVRSLHQGMTALSGS